MALSVTPKLYTYPKGIDNTQRCTYARGTVSIGGSGNYVAGGIPITWTFDAGLKVVGNPFQVTFFSEGYVYNSTASLLIGGYEYIWNVANNTLQIMALSSGSAGSSPAYQELGNGDSIPAAVTNDTIAFEAVFVKNGAF